jgi:hypothetical protein
MLACRFRVGLVFGGRRSLVGWLVGCVGSCRVRVLARDSTLSLCPGGCWRRGRRGNPEYGVRIERNRGAAGVGFFVIATRKNGAVTTCASAGGGVGRAGWEEPISLGRTSGVRASAEQLRWQFKRRWDGVAGFRGAAGPDVLVLHWWGKQPPWDRRRRHEKRRGFVGRRTTRFGPKRLAVTRTQFPIKRHSETLTLPTIFTPPLLSLPPPHTQPGRWPVKSVKVILNLLKNAQSNAEAKDLSVEELVIKNIVVQQAPVSDRRSPRPQVEKPPDRSDGSLSPLLENPPQNLPRSRSYQPIPRSPVPRRGLPLHPVLRGSPRQGPGR